MLDLIGRAWGARPGTEIRHLHFERREAVSLGSHGPLVAEAGSEVGWAFCGRPVVGLQGAPCTPTRVRFADM